MGMNSGKRNGVLCGRGTTALWLALRAIQRRDGPGEVIVPDLLCSTALEGALLAGFTPVFADVLSRRFTLSPESVAELVTPYTRAVLVAHLFGHGADIASIRAAAPGIPLIEDAVQGLGGSVQDQPIGSLSDISFISYDAHKMIGGRGGVVFFEDETLLEGIEEDIRRLPELPEFPLDQLKTLLPPTAASVYASQLRTVAPTLLRRFDSSRANVNRIQADWETLQARIVDRNAKAYWLQDQLSGLPLELPEMRAGDAIWRYTITVSTVAAARRIMRDLQLAGLPGSGLYYPLSQFFGQKKHRLTNRLVNLWVDESIIEEHLRCTVDVIKNVLR
jgi:dTDP-4-amino-4,6-dideoxygalactose transaminase